MLNGTSNMPARFKVQFNRHKCLKIGTALQLNVGLKDRRKFSQYLICIVYFIHTCKVIHW